MTARRTSCAIWSRSLQTRQKRQTVSLGGADFRSGRSVWIRCVQHLLAKRAKAVSGHYGHEDPAPGEEWPLTDHPVLRLNFSSIPWIEAFRPRTVDAERYASAADLAALAYVAGAGRPRSTRHRVPLSSGNQEPSSAALEPLFAKDPKVPLRCTKLQPPRRFPTTFRASTSRTSSNVSGEHCAGAGRGAPREFLNT